MHPSVYKRPLLWTLIVLIIGLVCFYRPSPSADDVFYAISQEPVTLTGVVENFYTPKPKSNNVVLKVRTVNGRKAEGRVYARFTDFVPQWKDTLAVTGKLQKPFGEEVLGNFNWREYLRTKAVFTEIKPSEVRVEKRAGVLWRALRFVRADILRVFAEHFEPSLAHIAGGVLLGERGELDPALFTAFQDSGAVHLLVASGGNVGFVMFLAVAVCGLFGMGYRKQLVLSLAAAGIYTLVAGADAPLLRAYFMALSAGAGYLLGRDSGIFQGLLLSCLVILCIWPASVFETGFQMSFLATLAIIMTAENYRLPKKWPRWAYFFAQIFMATLASQLILLPVFANVFRKVSLAGLAANMLLVPLASLLLGLSFAFYVSVRLHLGFVLFFPLLWALKLFKLLVEFFAALPFAAVPVTAWRAGTVVAFYAVLFWVFHLPQRDFAKKAALPVLAVCVLALSVQAAFFSDPEICLIRQGRYGTAVLRTADGVFVAGDCLAPDKLRNVLYALGVKRAGALFALRPRGGGDDFTPLADEVIYPFEQDVWPQGKSFTFARMQVRAVWPLFYSRTGGLYTREGYGGRGTRSVSYCFNGPYPQVCIGAGGTFAVIGDEVWAGRPNQSLCRKIRL